jgi:hypothetical protein
MDALDIISLLSEIISEYAADGLGAKLYLGTEDGAHVWGA